MYQRQKKRLKIEKGYPSKIYRFVVNSRPIDHFMTSHFSHTKHGIGGRRWWTIYWRVKGGRIIGSFLIPNFSPFLV